MDCLTAFVTIANLKVRLEMLQLKLKHNPSFLKDIEMATPKLQGLAKALAMLEHSVEDGAEKLLKKIESVGDRSEAAFAKGVTKVDGIASRVAEVESFVTALEGANGGEPLDDPEQPTHSTPLPDAPSLATPPVERTVVVG